MEDTIPVVYLRKIRHSIDHISGFATDPGIEGKKNCVGNMKTV